MREHCPEEKRLPLLMGDELRTEDRRGLERHIESCPACRVRLRELRSVVAALGTAAGPNLSGAACARSDDVLAFAEGSAPADARRDIEEHVARCSSCRALLADLWAMSGESDMDVPGHVVRRVLDRLEADATSAVVRLVREGVEVVRRFAEEAAGPALEPAPARGPGDVVLTWAGPGGLAVGLTVRARGDEAEVIGRALVEGSPAPDLTVALAGASGERGPESPDGAGRFGPWGLSDGENRILIRAPGAERPAVLGLTLERADPC
ncbi:MAG: hypothetical protein GF405_04535 [Candidatus Eisenbacteria bacterium]|nr:hypothetical protein [Candidatus Eisenbacteria bacterium]